MKNILLLLVLMLGFVIPSEAQNKREIRNPYDWSSNVLDSWSYHNRLVPDEEKKIRLKGRWGRKQGTICLAVLGKTKLPPGTKLVPWISIHGPVGPYEAYADDIIQVGRDGQFFYRRLYGKHGKLIAGYDRHLIYNDVGIRFVGLENSNIVSETICIPTRRRGPTRKKGSR